MAIKDLYNKSKKIAKNAIIAYAMIGSFLYSGICSEKTGHQSADLYLGKSHMTKVEKAIFNPIFKRFNIESKIMENK